MSQTVQDARFAAMVLLHVCAGFSVYPHSEKWLRALAGQLASFDPAERGFDWWAGIVGSTSEIMLNNADHQRLMERNGVARQEPTSSK